jgi:kumamolisin
MLNNQSTAHIFANTIRQPAPGAVATAAIDPGAKIKLTLRLRRRPDAPPPPAPGAYSSEPARSRSHMSREDYEARYGAADADIDAVKTFAKAHGLAVDSADAGRRTVEVSGAADKVNAAFGVQLKHYAGHGHDYMGHEGAASVPADLGGVVEDVVGLDTRPLAEPLTRQAASDLATSALLPAQVAKLYGMASLAAPGQTIAILEFGGGYRATDIQNYFQNIAHLPVPTVTFVGVDGATNAPNASIPVAQNPDSEVILDIAVAGSVAQGAKLVIYFAPNTSKGWLDCVTTAIHDKTNKPTTISISWGGGESGWGSFANTMSSAFAEAAPLGVSVFASSGDGGSGSPAQVLYPASDPNISGCGGVTISNVSGTSFTETAWGGSGGGVSNIFAQPSWQSWAGIPPSTNPAGHVGRGVPDISGNADPASGYQLILNGVSIGVWGGTSAVAPFYAAVTAVLNATLGLPLGFQNPNLYAFEGPYVFTDVTSGSNGAYSAHAGWDAVTGLGSLIVGAYQTALLGIGLPPALTAYANKLFMGWKGVEFDDRLWWTSYNGSAWAAQQQIPGVAGSAGIAFAVFNNELYAAWKGMGNDQGIWWSYFNGSTWQPQKEVSGVATSTGPRLAVYGGKLYMAWKGMEDDQRLWWSSFNGATWAAQQQIPGVASSVGPAIAAFGNGLVAAWKGEFGDPRLWYSTFNGQAWSAQQVIPNTGTSEGPSLAVYNGVLYAVWKGEYADQTMWWSTYNGQTWAPQKQIPGVWSSVGPGLAVFGNKLFMAWKGMNGDERIWYTAYNGASWAAQQIVPGVGTSTDLIVETVAAE